MKITVKLFATLREYNKNNNTGTLTLEVREHCKVNEVLDILNIPEDIPKIILINGKQKEFEDKLVEGDTLSVFPPIAGG